MVQQDEKNKVSAELCSLLCSVRVLNWLGLTAWEDSRQSGEDVVLQEDSNEMIVD